MGVVGAIFAGNSTMRVKLLFSAALAVLFGTLALAPQAALAHGSVVAVRESYMAGTIVIKTRERALYYFVGPGEAIRYPVGVGRIGMQWAGTAYIDGKYIKPAWSPPDSIRKDYRSLPPVIPGGSPQNPMGVAAMTLSGGGQYAIHGTNNEGSIGGFVSHGCIRMHNADITDLYGRVGIGTRVVVIQ
jgi:lipoprotein-anchoring transpeptidase ErfK/SrfK